MISHALIRPLRFAVAPILVCCALAASLIAAEPAIDVQLGFDGDYKVSHWMPVFVTLTAGDSDLNGSLEISAPDGDGVECVHIDAKNQRVHIPSGEQQTILQYVRLGRARGRIEVRLQAAEKEIVSHRMALDDRSSTLPSTQQWLLVVGGPLRLGAAAQRRAEQGRHVTTVDSASDLPDLWFGYEGVDIIVLTTANAELIQQLSAAQRRALEQWVRMGGTLLLSAGSNAAELAGEGGPLATLVTNPIQSTVKIEEAPGLESVARAEQRLPEFTLAVLEEPAGEIVSYVEERSSGERPAIVRSDFGFGKIVLFAFDIDRPPFTDWEHTGALVSSLLFGETNLADQAEDGQEFSQIGYQEMAGQLRGALDHFPGTEDHPGVTVVTFWTVFPLLLIYIALIGPGDFLFLRRLIRRMEWTWITFPLLIISTSVAVFLLGRYWRGGGELRLNQVDVVDIDPLEGIVRGTTWAQLYSPSSARYDLQMRPQPAVEEPETDSNAGALLTWQGLPGHGLGGADNESVEILPAAAYRLSMQHSAPETKLEQLLIPTAASKSFVGRWWREQSFEPPAVITVDHNGILHGAVQNPLNIPLTDTMVAHDQWVYRFDQTFDPGESLRLDGIQRRDLEWRLTRRRVLQSTTSYSSTPWDPQSRDVERILELMMFYKAGGGKDYTTLGQHYQAFIDLSEQLRLGRAILVGRSAQPATQLQHGETSLTDSAEQQWTWYRIVLPVERTTATSRNIGEGAQGVLH